MRKRKRGGKNKIKKRWIKREGVVYVISHEI
jgi:ribosomal protein L36